MSIAVFGSINIDVTTYGQRTPQPGETLHADRYALGLGGKGCNQAIAAARLGAPTHLIGRIGKDGFGDTAIAELTKAGLATDHIAIDPEVGTGIAVISIDASAQNSITVIGGANMAITPEHVDAQSALLDSSKILLLQLETPLPSALRAAERVRSNGGVVILDPAPVPPGGLPDEVFPLISYITPNETETGLLTGITPKNEEEARQAAAILRNKGAAGAVIKLGAKGVYFQTADDEGFVPPFAVTAIDTVAAGDSFNGGLACALSEGQAFDAAIRFAAACGALATTKHGASAAAPEREDVDTLMSS